MARHHTQESGPLPLSVFVSLVSDLISSTPRTFRPQHGGRGGPPPSAWARGGGERLVGGRIPTGASRSWRPCRWRGTRCRPPPTAGPRPRTHAPETGTLGGGENAVWEAFSPPTPPQRICPKGIVLPKLFSPHGPARFSPTFSLGARMRRTGSAPPPPPRGRPRAPDGDPAAAFPPGPRRVPHHRRGAGAPPPACGRRLPPAPLAPPCGCPDARPFPSLTVCPADPILGSRSIPSLSAQDIALDRGRAAA